MFSFVGKKTEENKDIYIYSYLIILPKINTAKKQDTS